MTRGEFLAALFVAGFIDLRAISGGSVQQQFVTATNAALVDDMAEHFSDRNVFVGIAERASASRGRLEDCTFLRALFADIDLKDYDGDAVAARQQLDAFPVAPSVVVNTGGGLHIYFLLAEPLDLRTDAARAKSLLQRLARAVGGDMKAAEPARILRLPGTRNWKYDPPRDVIIESATAQVHPLADLEALLPPAEAEDAPSKALPATIVTGERNELLFHEGCRLRERGFTEKEILATLDAMNAERVQPPLPASEVRTIAQSASKYEPGTEEFDVYGTGHRKAGEVVPDSQKNVRLGLAKLGLQVRYNAFANVALVNDVNGREKPLDDTIMNRAWLLTDEKFHFRPSLAFFEIVVQDTARRASFHPVRDYLGSLRWDGTERIDHWLHLYGGAPDTAYTQAIGALMLTAAVRRVRVPGSKFDEILIAEGATGVDKSTAWRTLCPNEDWFGDDLPLGVDSKQVIERSSGKWIIEASELQGYGNAEIEKLKSFLSRQTDGPVRLAYGRTSVEVPRQFVLVGSTNEATEYLRDSTGNRRFWPFTVSHWNIDALARDRDQLWAEAVVREGSGISIRLPQHLWPVAAAEQEARREVDPWEERFDGEIDFNVDAIPVDRLWRVLGDAGKFMKKNDAARISKVMQRRGFTRKKKIDSECQVTRTNGVTTEVRRVWAWIREGCDPAKVEWSRNEPF